MRFLNYQLDDAINTGILNQEGDILDLKKILQFLRVSDKKHERTSTYFTRLSEKQKLIHSNISSHPILQRIHAWQKELPKDQIWLLQRLSKKVLIEQGYTLYNPEKLSFKSKMKILYYWILFISTLKGKYTMLKIFLKTRKCKDNLLTTND